MSTSPSEPQRPSTASSPPSAPARTTPPAGRGALLVAAGIMASRVMGLVRERALAHYLGNGLVAGAFRAAIRIPNFLQNLFGEGVLSASFIPVYAQLLSKEDREEADRVAGAVFGLLALAMGVMVALGVLFTPAFIDVVAPGFEGEVRALTIRLVRILFPMVGMMVLAAWCLGILNSHRRFFLSYASGVLWSLAMIVALLALGGRLEPERLAIAVAWASVVGSLLQFGVQLPRVLSLLGRFRPSLDLARASVRQVLRSFGPVLVGRGVVQLSAFVDTAIATEISARAVSSMGYAQILSLLPVSLFGMAVSAAELPELSRTTGEQGEVAHKFQARINAGMRRIAFLVVPSVAAFVFVGDVVAGALFQTGRFDAHDTRYVWYLLVGSAFGLLASTLGRLQSSAYYALRDTRTPLYTATLRVAITIASAWVFGLYVPAWLGLPRELGGALILATTGLAGWVEFLLLRRGLSRRIGRIGFEAGYSQRLWAAAVGAGLLGLGLKMLLTRWRGLDPAVLREWHGGLLAPPHLHPLITAVLVLGTFGAAYFALTAALGIPESRAMLGRFTRRLRRS
ncbi:murein biosynthesis integral membrane protein MurJ [Aggregicoccus sp. 17bor-14]|uniref:murein biosynthesis integral membrane protein MurJ n=1 Tax=Myxococcaceae TaxID=31 RepID=UPI00351A017D